MVALAADSPYERAILVFVGRLNGHILRVLTDGCAFRERPVQEDSPRFGEHSPGQIFVKIEVFVRRWKGEGDG